MLPDNVFILWMVRRTSRLFLGSALLPLSWGVVWGGGAAVTGRGVAGEMLNNDFIRTAVVMTGAAGL